MGGILSSLAVSGKRGLAPQKCAPGPYRRLAGNRVHIVPITAAFVPILKTELDLIGMVLAEWDLTDRLFGRSHVRRNDSLRRG